MEVLLAITGLLFVALLTLGTALAVAAEFSLTSLERSTVDAHAREIGDRRAKAVQHAHRTLSFQLSGAQVAITLTT
ncbi:CNNM domain-containing protein, partial [Klebsiella pneumoniae]|nr:CNNM domain-containing protein [Klebsiella pneumoniae]